MEEVDHKIDHKDDQESEVFNEVNIKLNIKEKENLIYNCEQLYEEIYGKKSRVSVGHQHKQILFMVIDYYDKNLKQFSIKTRFTGNDLKYICKQLIQGLLYAHQINICHRDIKPHNLLIIK